MALTRHMHLHIHNSLTLRCSIFCYTTFPSSSERFLIGVDWERRPAICFWLRYLTLLLLWLSMTTSDRTMHVHTSPSPSPSPSPVLEPLPWSGLVSESKVPFYPSTLLPYPYLYLSAFEIPPLLSSLVPCHAWLAGPCSRWMEWTLVPTYFTFSGLSVYLSLSYLTLPCTTMRVGKLAGRYWRWCWKWFPG